MIGRRIARLPEGTERLLTIGALIGREFELDLLVDVAGDDEDTVLDALERACTARLVEEVAGTIGRYSFVHALTREALYDSLGATRRARLHRRVAEAIESRYADDLEDHFAALVVPLRGRGDRRAQGGRVRGPRRSAGSHAARARGRGQAVRARPRSPRRAGPGAVRPAPRAGGSAPARRRRPRVTDRLRGGGQARSHARRRRAPRTGRGRELPRPRAWRTPAGTNP